MGRINPNEADNYSAGNSNEWLKLTDDGDIARVQFLYNKYEDLDVFACHRVQTGYDQKGKPIERWVNCLREYDEPVDLCPFCEAQLPVKPVVMLSMYDHNDKKVKIWERGKKFLGVMQGKFNRYPNLSRMVFEIERHGVKGDQQTSYEVIAMPEVAPYDISDIEKPEFLGTVILDKTPDDMQAYLNNGSFPEVNDTDNTSRRSAEPVRRRDSEPVSRASRRGV